MGSINIEGLGVVDIEGEAPNEMEQAAIINALQSLPDDEPEPQEAEAPIDDQQDIVTQHEASGEPADQEPVQEGEGDGPIGIMPPEIRGEVRKKIEDQPGLIQLILEAGPSVGGAIAGAVKGAPFFPPWGSLAGATIGGLSGELLAQETGVAPESELNLALAGAGPAAGHLAGSTLKGGRILARKGFTNMPFVRTAMAKNTMSRAVQEFESVGTKIISKQKGLMARKSGELYDAVRRAGVIVPPKSLSGTQNAIREMIEEMDVIKPFPEVKQAIKVLKNISETLDAGDVSMDTLVRVRQIAGKVVSRTERVGGIKLGAAKNVYKAISQDLDKIAADPSLKGRVARVAQTATQRAKLEFAVKDLESGAARFITDVPNGSSINVKGFQKWFRNITNPKSKQFDKSFSDALKDEIPEMSNRLKDLLKVVDVGGPGGPGSLVLRGRFSAIGATVGGLVGFGGAGGPGAAMGAVAGATAPEMLVSLLTSKHGAEFLTRAAEIGKGQINQKTWMAIGQLITRSAGEQAESKQYPANISAPSAL